MTFLGRRVKRKDLPRFTVLIVAAIVVTGFLTAVFSTMFDIHEVRGEIKDCKDAIAQKEGELKRLEQKKEYYESEEFFEDAVRDSGYVDENETVFVVTD